MNIKNNTLLSLLLSLTALFSSAQTYQFTNYSVNEGLPGKFIYTIDQGNNGFLWLSTAKGLCRFDGFDFYNVYTADSAENVYAVSSFKTNNGRIYYGFKDGSAHYTDGAELINIEGIDATIINDIFQGSDSLIYCVSQSQGIFTVDPENNMDVKELAIPTDNFLQCGLFVSEDGLLLGTMQGLILCRLTDDILEFIDDVPELQYNKIQKIIRGKTDNLFYIATEDEGVYSASIIDDEILISRISEDQLFTMSRAQSLFIDKSGMLWISTFSDGVIKAELSDEDGSVISYEQYKQSSGLPSNDVKVCFEDLEGNIWMGLFGDGISILSSEAYKFFRTGISNNQNDIVFVGEMSGYAFAGTAFGYYLFDVQSEEVVSYTDLRAGINNARISDYFLYEDGSMLIGTEGNGVFIRDRNGRIVSFFSSGNNLENYITDILDDDHHVWLGTRSGVIMIDIESGNSVRFTTSEKLPHNFIRQIVADSDGRVIIATEGNRLYTLDPESGIQSGKAVTYGGGRKVFQSFDIDGRRKVWGATRGSGLYCFSNDSVWGLSNQDGLFSDYCYSILCDSKNNIWVGHEGGFSYYNQNLEIVRTFTDIFSSGAICNENAITEMSTSHVIIGTTEGLLVYNPEKDKSKYVPPKTNILSVSIDGVRMPLQPSYDLPYSSRYSITVDYVGLNYSNPDKVYYSYSLENYDTEWSDATFTRTVNYKLSDGHYRFNLLSYSYDGLSDSDVKSFEINIKKPIWRMWWFILSCFAFSIALVITIIKIRERAQAKAKKYLEKELSQRTKEVINQKEEIVYQNREITDSINYAQRIQASLLPPVEKLGASFNGSFLFYRPRDIVSGDFYWFDQISESKIIMVCADSTGHGVPGAFMSMIGSALLQEIVNRKEITRPSEILTTLDREISSTLNQRDDDNSSSDGMDMVVCEYDTRSRLLRFASALRPVILIMDGEQYYIRGNKNSVGGEEHSQKYFDDQEYYLKKDDIIYLFSDGYPDQFGGPDGKKLKILRLKHLIDEIKDKPMEEQNIIVADYFDQWKGDLDQVDDVLFMGIKI